MNDWGPVMVVAPLAKTTLADNLASASVPVKEPASVEPEISTL